MGGWESRELGDEAGHQHLCSHSPLWPLQTELQGQAQEETWFSLAMIVQHTVLGELLRGRERLSDYLGFNSIPHLLSTLQFTKCLSIHSLLSFSHCSHPALRTSSNTDCLRM